MKRLLVLTQFFYPDKLSTGKVLAELFFALNPQKYEITIVSGRKLYQDKDNTVLPRYEEKENIKIYRVLKKNMSKEKAWGRIYNYIAFFCLSFFKVFSAGIYKKKDVIFTVSNPPIMPLLGALLKNKNNKFIYLIHDLYPDIAIKLGIISETNLMAKAMYKINKFVFLKADKIIVLGRDMKQYLIKNYFVPEDKIEVIPNWSKKMRFIMPRTETDKFRLLYTGNMGRFHELEIAINVAYRLKDEMELVFVGEGAQKAKLVKLVNSESINNVKFFDYLDDEAYKEILNNADALLLSLEKGLAGLAVPSKFYTYLATGKPVVAITDKQSEVAIAIQEEKCGIVVDHDNVDYFVEELSNMIHNKESCDVMGGNAYHAFVEKYERDIIINQYENIFLGE